MALSVRPPPNPASSSPQADARPLQWRSFDFFDAAPVRLADDDTRAFLEAGNGNAVASVCSGSDSLFLGGRDGTVRIVAAGWKVVRVFAAYDDGSPVTHMRQVEGTSLLVTVGEEGGEAPPVLKVWALDKLVKKTGVPTCLSVVVVNNGKKPFPVGCFWVFGGVGLGSC